MTKLEPKITEVSSWNSQKILQFFFLIQGIVLVTEICLDNKEEQTEFERFFSFFLMGREKGTGLE